MHAAALLQTTLLLLLLAAPRCLGHGQQERHLLQAASNATLPARIRCSTRSPTAQEKYALERNLSQWMSTSKTSTKPINIGVYLHIITNVAGQGKPTKKQIAAQFRVLNQSFSKGKITFKLLDTDVVANDTWYEATLGTQGEYDMKAVLRRGTARHLNVYTSNPADLALGWARYPWDYKTRPSQDGIVVWFGSLPGGSDPQYSLGDTAVHEVGHWLGLYHTFDGGCSLDNDLVLDTPAEAVPAFGCPVGRDTCTRSQFKGKDPIRNFMDYSEDACMDHFTPGQFRRMRAIWTLFRGSF